MKQKLSQIEPNSLKNLAKVEKLLVYGLASIITLIASIYFEIVGYPQVVTATETLTFTTPAIYMIPIFFPFGILFGEIIWETYKDWDLRKTSIDSGALFLIVILSSLRLIFKLPFSGHSLILSYFLLNEYHRKYPIRIIIGLLVFLLTLFFKICLWKDLITFFSGLTLGTLIWAFRIFILNKK